MVRARRSTWGEQITVPFCWARSRLGGGGRGGNDNYFARRVYRNPLEVDRLTTAMRRGMRRLVPTPLTIPGTKCAEQAHHSHRRAADFFSPIAGATGSTSAQRRRYIPFEFDLTDALELRDGEYPPRLFSRRGPAGNREQPSASIGLVFERERHLADVFPSRAPRPASNAFEITTDVEAGEAAFRIWTTGGTACAVEITGPDGRRFSTRLPSLTVLVQARSRCESVLWDPIPASLLRPIHAEQRSSEPMRTSCTHFGVRSLSTRPSDDPASPAALTLNGEAIYIRVRCTNPTSQMGSTRRVTAGPEDDISLREAVRASICCACTQGR